MLTGYDDYEDDLDYGEDELLPTVVAAALQYSTTDTDLQPASAAHVATMEARQDVGRTPQEDEGFTEGIEIGPAQIQGEAAPVFNDLEEGELLAEGDDLKSQTDTATTGSAVTRATADNQVRRGLAIRGMAQRALRNSSEDAHSQHRFRPEPYHRHSRSSDRPTSHWASGTPSSAQYRTSWDAGSSAGPARSPRANTPLDRRRSSAPLVNSVFEARGRAPSHSTAAHAPTAQWVRRSDGPRLIPRPSPAFLPTGDYAPLQSSSARNTYGYVPHRPGPTAHPVSSASTSNYSAQHVQTSLGPSYYHRPSPAPFPPPRNPRSQPARPRAKSDAPFPPSHHVAHPHTPANSRPAGSSSCPPPNAHARGPLPASHPCQPPSQQQQPQQHLTLPVPLPIPVVLDPLSLTAMQIGYSVMAAHAHAQQMAVAQQEQQRAADTRAIPMRAPVREPAAPAGWAGEGGAQGTAKGREQDAEWQERVDEARAWE